MRRASTAGRGARRCGPVGAVAASRRAALVLRRRLPAHTLDRDDFDRMDQGRVGTLRVALPWHEVDPTPVAGRLRLGALRRHRRRRCASTAIDVLPTVYTVPTGSRRSSTARRRPNGPCSITPPHTELGLSPWRTFLAEAVGRYGPGGLLLGAASRRCATQPITAWQIWNEENSPGFFQPRPDVGPLRRRCCSAASEAIRGQDPDAEVVLGGLFGYPLNGRDGGLRATDYLRELYADPGIEAAFDGRRRSTRTRPHAPGVKGQMRRINHIVREAGDEQARIWITEIGWGSGGKRDAAQPRPRRPGAAAAPGVPLLRRPRARHAHPDRALVRVARRRRARRAAASGARARASSRSAR